MKKRVIVALCSTIAFSSFYFSGFAKANEVTEPEKVNVSTDTELTEEERLNIIDNLEVSEGVEQEQINDLDDAMLYELSQDSGEIVSVETENSYIYEPTATTKIMAAKTMPTKDFKLTVVAQRIKEKSGDNFKFTATGDWKASPFWELEDTIALAWSDSFTMYNDYSYMYGYVGSKQTMKPGSRNKVKNEVGVAHDVDLQPAVTDDKAVLVAKVYKKNSSGSANVSAEYAHVTKVAKITGVTITGGGGAPPSISFDISGGAGLEEASPAYTSFSY